MGKFFDETLELLGGERIYKYGEGDENDGNTEEQFEIWKENLWKELFAYYSKNGKVPNGKVESKEEEKKNMLSLAT